MDGFPLAGYVVAPDVTELGRLAGRQVAIPFWWSIHNIVLQKLLRANGLRPVVRTEPSRSAGTVGLVVMSPSDMLPALANGAIGGYTVADPFNAAAEIKGVGRMEACVWPAVWRSRLLESVSGLQQFLELFALLADAIGIPLLVPAARQRRRLFDQLTNIVL